MDELQRARPKIEPPTYEVELPGTLDPLTNRPRVEKHFHDSTTTETADEKEAYVAYLDRVTQERLDHSDRALKLTLLRGIKIDVPDLTQWKAERTFLGLPLPEDPMELKFLWIYTEVLGTLDDLRKVQRGVEVASGVSEEEISSTEDTFRGSVGQSDGDGVTGIADTSNGAIVVLQPTLRASKSGIGTGDGGKRVRRARRK